MTIGEPQETRHEIDIPEDLPGAVEIQRTTDSLPSTILTPPSDVLINVYWTQEANNPTKPEEEVLIPNWEGMLSIWAFAMLNDEIQKKHPNHKTKVYFAGNHRNNHGGISMSTIYANYVRALNLSGVEVVDEAEVEGKRKALDTRGEIRFFDSALQKASFRDPIPLIISRANHTPRIRLLTANNIHERCDHLTSEGILAYFMNENMSTTLNDPEVKKEYESFTQSEQTKLKMMGLLGDEDGRIIELMARVLNSGPKELIQKLLKR